MRRLEWSRAVGVMLLAGTLVLAVGCTGARQSPTPKPIEKDAKYSVRLARSLFDGGRVSEALAELEQATERFPDDASLYNAYGSFLWTAGRSEQALAAFTRVLEIDPYFTDAHNHLGVVYLGQKDYGRSESEFKKALEDPAYPTPHFVYLNLGQLYAEQGRNDEAITAMSKSVGIDPGFFKAHFHLASLLDEIGQLIEAAREYEVAEPAFRNDGEYWYRRGFAYYRLGETGKARDSLLRVRSIAPGSESAARADELLSVLD